MWLTQVMAVRTRPGPGWTRTHSLIYALALDPVDFNTRVWPVNTWGHSIPASSVGYELHFTCGVGAVSFGALATFSEGS
jgi:hypothetical protein